MESGQGNLSDLRASLAAAGGSAFVRAAVAAGGRALHLDAVVAPPGEPAGWHPISWEYQAVTFIAAQVPASELAAALCKDGGQVLHLGSHDITLPPAAEQFSWRRTPARARWDSVLLPWPARTSTLQAPDPQGPQAPREYLIGDDCPSFPCTAPELRAGAVSCGLVRWL